MEESQLSSKLLSRLDQKLSDSFSVKSEYTPQSSEADLNVVYDLAILKGESLIALAELTTSKDTLTHEKKKLRNFYGPKGSESEIIMISASPKQVVVFDYDQEISSEEFDENDVEKVSEIIVDNLTS